MYMMVYMMMYTSGYCVEGYYCNHTSTEPDQYVCPAGHYCPTGTGTPNACPEGTFSPIEGNNHLDDCLNCTAGYYCQGKSLYINVHQHHYSHSTSAA